MAWTILPDGVPLWYEDRGSGPVVVLVPGWTFTTRFYDQQAHDLQRDHRVIAFDHRGAGSSGKTPSGHSLSQYADDLVHLLDTLEMENATLVGWAMGVSVAVHALHRDARRIGGLVWTDHSPRFFSDRTWALGLHGELTPWQWDDQIRQLQEDRFNATKELVASCFHRTLREDELTWMTAELFRTPTDIMAHMLATVANVDLRPMLAEIDVPVLVVNGRHSIVPSEVGSWLAGTIGGARAVVVEDCGHMPHYEKPSQFNQLVRGFIASARTHP